MNSSSRLASLTMLLALVAGVVEASEGVIEINHVRALAGSVTSGDTPGYPVTISQPGSYRLTSNLVQPDASTDVILVDAENVSIDLNQFLISGTNICSGGACTASGTGRGVRSGRPFTTVRNGSFKGIAGPAISFNSASGKALDLLVSLSGGTGPAGGCVDMTVSSQMAGMAINVVTNYCEKVGIRANFVRDSRAYGCGQEGIHADSAVNSQAHDNLATGIQAAYVIDSSAMSNGGHGVVGIHVSRSRILDNHLDGVHVPQGSRAGIVVDNVIAGNTGYGVYAGGNGVNVGVGRNALDDNTAGARGAFGTGSVHSLPPNSNLCNGVVC